MKGEPRDHRVTIHHTVGGDIHKTRYVETFDLTATEWEQRPERERRQIEAGMARHAALNRSE